MLDKTDDDIFSADDSRALFDRIPGTTNRLSISPGLHDEWSDEMIEESIHFIEAHAGPEAGDDTPRGASGPAD